MCTRRLTLKIFFSLYLFLFSAQHVFAGHNDGFISSLKDGNNNIFKRHDVQKAVNEFCQTLSLNPKNKTVQENFNAIVLHPGLTAAQKSEALLLEDFLGYIKNLQGRIHYLTSKRNLLKDQLIEKGYAKEALSRGLLHVKDNISLSQEVFSYQEQASFNRSSPLMIINSLLGDEKARLSMRVRSLQNQYDWLKTASKNKQYLASQYFTQSVDKPRSLSFKDAVDAGSKDDTVLVLTQEVRGGDRLLTESREEGLSLEHGFEEETIAEVISLQPVNIGEKSGEEKSLRKFKKELGVLYVQLDALEERVEKGDDQSNELAGQVVDLSLKLSETEMLLNEKVETITFLKTEFTDVEQRYALGKRIIQEKDREIQSLQEIFEQVQSEAKNREEKQNDVIALKDRQIADLEIFLSGASLKKEELEDVIVLKDKKLTEFEASLSEGFNKREELEGVIGSKKQQLAELEAFLKVYRDDLATSDKEVQRKIKNLKVIQKELSDVQAKVQLGQKAIQEKGEQMTAIRNELADMRLVDQNGAEGVNTLIIKKNKELKELNGILNIYRQSLGDANQVIKEKSGQLGSLKDELVKLRNQLIVKENQYGKKDYQIRILKETLLSEKNKREQRNINLRRVILQKDQAIEKLKEQLWRAQKSLEMANQTVQEKVAYLNYAKNELTALRLRMKSGAEIVKTGIPGNQSSQDPGEKLLEVSRWGKQLDNIVESKDEKLIELNGILEIYKKKLVTESENIRKKTADITVLEKQLKFLENELQKRSEVLIKTQRDLRDLEDQLTAMQHKLLKLNDRPKQGGMQDYNVENEVREFQSKFRDINNFLLENLHDSDRINTHLAVQQF